MSGAPGQREGDANGAAPAPGPIAALAVPAASFSHGSRFGSFYRELTNAGGGSHVGVCLEDLPPGKQTCPQHYHMLEEEHVYMLEGEAVVLLGDAEHVMRAGDYICFPAGRAVAHAMVNRSQTTCRYLIIGERNPNEVLVYPENNRVAVRLLGEGYRRQPLEYWEGIDPGAEAPQVP